MIGFHVKLAQCDTEYLGNSRYIWNSQFYETDRSALRFKFQILRAIHRGPRIYGPISYLGILEKESRENREPRTASFSLASRER